MNKKIIISIVVSFLVLGALEASEQKSQIATSSHATALNDSASGDRGPRLSTVVGVERLTLHQLIREFFREIHQNDYPLSHHTITITCEMVLEKIESAKKCGKIDEKDWGITPFHEISLQTGPSGQVGKHTIMRALIAAGADVNALKYDSYTPLHVIAGTNPFDFEALKIVVEAGAVIDPMSSSNTTPLYELVTRIRKSSVQGDAQKQKRNGVRLLLANGANAHSKNMCDETLLHVTNDGEIARMIIARGVDVNARTNCGDTPLHSAACLGRVGVVRALLGIPPSISQKDPGASPLAD